jgi:hypothetical protein
VRYLEDSVGLCAWFIIRTAVTVVKTSQETGSLGALTQKIVLFITRSEYDSGKAISK